MKRSSNFTRCRTGRALQACLLGGWLILVPTSLHARQADPPPTVTAIEFTGLDRTPVALVKDVVRVRVGDRLEKAELDSAITRLLRTGRFLAATYRIDETDAGVRVTFELRERLIVSAITFEGNEKFDDRRLLSEVVQKVGEPVDWFNVRDGADAILGLYREAGYSDVVVTFDRTRIEQTGELVYTIREGTQVRIRKIVFEGNASLPARELKRQIVTKTALWFFRTGAFDEDGTETDVARLANYYRDYGFLDARASYRKEVSEDGRDLTIVFTIEEGIQYAIEDIQFRGNAELSAEELAELIESGMGATVRRRQVDADARAIRTRYGELGFLYAGVRAIRVFSDTPGLVRITFEIAEGEQFRVGRIAVRGNTRTKDKVIRRTLDLYPPDDLFNLTAAKNAEQQLLSTRIFSSARVLPVGNAPGVRDAVIDVTEAEKSGDFLFGFGVTSNSGLVGSVVLDLQNFDLFDPPRTLSELFKFRAFTGGGQRMRIELQPGTDLGRFRIDFTEPYLFDKPIRLDTGVYLFERGREGYTERRGGATVSVGKRFQRGRFRGWSGELALRVETVNIDDIDLFASGELRDDEGSNLMPSVKGTLVRDRTDNRYLPSSGDRLRISYQQFGIPVGDHVFGKANVRYNWYKTLSTDRLERKRVLHLRSEGGVILGNAPVFERYFAGGTGSIRGFEFRGVGERDGIDDTNVGGDFLVLLGAEYSYPVYGENLRGHVFFDTGTAGGGAYRASIGTGIRLTINLLGPLPIEVNLAVPISSDSDDDEQVFSFMVGGLF